MRRITNTVAMIIVAALAWVLTAAPVISEKEWELPMPWGVSVEDGVVSFDDRGIMDLPREERESAIDSAVSIWFHRDSLKREFINKNQ